MDACCRIIRARFDRDAPAFEQLCRELLKLLQLDITRGDKSVRCWGAGCASGEEVYTLKLGGKRLLPSTSSMTSNPPSEEAFQFEQQDIRQQMPLGSL